MEKSESKSELWTKFYEEEKSRLEKELLQAVFGSHSSIKSDGLSKDENNEYTGSILNGKQTALATKKATDYVELFAEASEPNIENTIKSSVSSAQVNKEGVKNLVISSLQPANANNSLGDKLQDIKNDLLQKWAQEYVSSSGSSKYMAPGQRHTLLEALMKIRGSVQTEHENLLRTQREFLVKQADMELQTQVLQDQIIIERQYRDYVLSKLAQYIYHSHDAPTDPFIEKSLEDIEKTTVLLNLLPNTLNDYLDQRFKLVYGECKRLVDQYTHRKLDTALSVLSQQQPVTATSSRLASSAGNIPEAGYQLQASLNAQMQDDLQSEKNWIQSRHSQSYSSSNKQKNSQSLRTVEHEMWQKAFYAYQKNITLAGQIALLKQLP